MSTQASALSLSVVVPAFNEEKLIASSLASIRYALDANARTNFSYELIVCNNNSTDRTGDLAAAAGARVVFEPVNQIARARNTGGRAAQNDWLLFVDADSWPSPALVSDLLRHIASGCYVGGGSVVAMQNLPFSAELVLRLWNALSCKVRWAAGAFVFCRRDAFTEVGGFNQELFASEEIDFSQRLHAWGAERGLDFRILDAHPLLTSERKMKLYSRGEHLRMIWKNMLSPRGAGVRDKDICHIWYDGRR